MMLALVAQRVVQFPLAYVLSHHTGLGALGLWWSFPVTNLLVAGVAACRFVKGDWKTIRLTEADRETVRVTQEAMIEEPVR